MFQILNGVSEDRSYFILAVLVWWYLYYQFVHILLLSSLLWMVPMIGNTYLYSVVFILFDGYFPYMVILLFECFC